MYLLNIHSYYYSTVSPLAKGRLDGSELKFRAGNELNASSLDNNICYYIV